MFGFGGNKAEDVRIENVAALAESLFSKKIATLDSKASRMIARIEDAKRLFVEACERFNILSTEPDLEDLYFASASHVKSQKTVYITALKRIVTFDNDEGEAKNYYSYESKLLKTEMMLSEILKINGTFRTVIYAYSKDLAQFKLSFAAIESATKELRYEIDLRAADVKEHKDVAYAIEELSSLLEEEITLGKEEASLLSADPGKAKQVSEEEKRKIDDAIRLKKEEISTLTAKISNADSGIKNLLNIIDKPARKHDYGSFSKIKLSSYIEDPERMLIRNSAGYADFHSQIQSLSKDIMGDILKLKNKDEVMRAVNQILSGKITEYIEQINSLNAQAEPLHHDLRDLEMIEKELKMIESGNASKETKLVQVRKRVAEIKELFAPKKGTLEVKFDYAYKKKISIILK